MQDKHTIAGESYRPALSSPKRGEHNAKQDWKTHTYTDKNKDTKHLVVKTTKQEAFEMLSSVLRL